MNLIHENGIIPFRFYFQFYWENKEKIHMKKSDGIGQHPVNREAVARWIERIGRLENEDERKFYLFFARAFASILETSYVPYNTFLSTLHAMADEIYLKIDADSYEQIIFILSGELEKSNTWISLLCMDYWNNTRPNLFKLQHTNTMKVLSFVDEVPALNLFRSLEGKRTLFLHFDDMSYSGGQAAKSIATVLDRIKFDVRKRLLSSTVDYYVAMPYVTAFAKAYILKHNVGVKFFTSTKVVPNILDQVQTYYDSLSKTEKAENSIYLSRLKAMCNKEYMRISNQSRFMLGRGPPEEIEKGIWAFRCSSYKTLIYFDHKLADDASTFQKVLYFGSYPMDTENDLCEVESLIQNCTVHPDVKEEMTNRRITPCWDYIQVLEAKKWNINQRVICPKTFYKGIDYTFGYRIERNNVVPTKLKTSEYKLIKYKGLWDNLVVFYIRILLPNIQLKIGPETYEAMNNDAKEKITNEMIEKYVPALGLKQLFLKMGTNENNALANQGSRKWQNIGYAITNKTVENSAPGWTSLWGLLGGKTRKQKDKKKKRKTIKTSK